MAFLQVALLALLSASAASATLIGGATSVSQYLPYLLAADRTGQQYASVGSGAGQRNFISKDYLIACSDDPMGAANYRASVTTGGVITMPLTLGTYSVIIAGTNNVRLSAKELSGIYRGSITSWSQIRSSAKPSGKVTPVARADASGTTELFTSYLFKARSGFPFSLVGLGPISFGRTTVYKTGSGGVAAYVKANAGSIGYVQTGIGISEYGCFEVAVQNSAGQYVLATRADPNQSIPRILPPGKSSWAGVSLVYTRGTGTYPISSFVFMFVRPSYRGNAQGKLAKKFLSYMMSTGAQNAASAYYFSPLPHNLVTLNVREIASVAV